MNLQLASSFLRVMNCLSGKILTSVWVSWEGWTTSGQYPLVLSWRGSRRSLSDYYISDKNKKKYQKVIEEFDRYFKVKNNMIYECLRFNRCSQLSEESVNQFITEVHLLIASCEFGAMKEELIGDCLVVDIPRSGLIRVTAVRTRPYPG